MVGGKGNSNGGEGSSFSCSSERSMSNGGDINISKSSSSVNRNSLEGNLDSAIEQRSGNSNNSTALEGENFEHAQKIVSGEQANKISLEGNLEAAKAQRTGQELPVRSQEQSRTGIKASTESEESSNPDLSYFEKSMNIIRANPDLALSGFEQRSLSETLKGLFAGEKLQETSETQIEKNSEQLIADKAVVENLLENNKDVKELTKEEWDSVINVGVNQAAEKHMSEIEQERLEKIKETISIIDIHQVIAENGVSENEARYIQGYFEPSTGKIKINKDAIGMDIGEVLVTVDHETLHKLSQRLDENGAPILNNIGLKRTNMSDLNTGMNEGTTEMYASRDWEEMLPERQEKSYVLEVNIMQQYEVIIGDEVLHDAYMKGGIEGMQDDFDKTMGIGSFDSFCRTMDEMWAAESNGQGKLAMIKHEELSDTLKEYSRRKENINNGNDE